MTNERKKAARQFTETWKGRGYEKGESQTFWNMLLRDVLGVGKPETFIEYEDQVLMDKSTGFIDGYIPAAKVLIEQKSADKDLSKPAKQSDGTFLTPFQQAKRYIVDLPVDRHPRWVITCNFREFHIYDMNKPKGEPEILLLKDLPNEYHRLSFITDPAALHLQKEMQVSLEAGEIVGKLYDAFAKQYQRIDESRDEQKSLNQLIVRIVFCLYAEDAGLFAKDQFHNYLSHYPAPQTRAALLRLFEILDQTGPERDPYLDPELAAFPYVNGGLFSSSIIVPQFTEEICGLILNDASVDFDWSGISPTIFGAVFESTLNPETRRLGGMHYTSIENIHKVIDPLFLDDLREELAEIRKLPLSNPKKIQKRVMEYRNRLADLKFLDPASGSGNFLTETYLSLRRLENEALAILEQTPGAQALIRDGFKYVSISQFYGIEINDFAVAVAQTALWIAESQMNQETENIVKFDLDSLPLKSTTNIREGNALTLDWNDVVPAGGLNYIMGNPPFVGARWMSAEQKNDVIAVFSEHWKNTGDLDYVTCWYKKATDYMEGTSIRAALVSTNSVAQGSSVANLWKPLFEGGVHIDFAHRTFRWGSEAKNIAHVHCVIIGFSTAPNNKPKIIFDDGVPQKAKNINAYLCDAENVFIESRKTPLCKIPGIGIGNQPVDDGNYLFTEEEMKAFIKVEPSSAKYFRPWFGAQEFIARKPRYCLYLGNCTPAELNRMPNCKKRVSAVRVFRAKSKRKSTQKGANIPANFLTTNLPQSTYLVIPTVSSERRQYVPIGFMNPDVICSDRVKIVPNATCYHFGVLLSSVHMSWMRAVTGRLKSDYNYSGKIVYNNFPWPEPAAEQKLAIEETAKAILDARKKYPDSSFADLYDEVTMPPDLRKAHEANDKAVMKAYGWKTNLTEPEIVARLMKLYQELTGG